MLDYLTIILLFIGIGIILTPFLKTIFGKDVWKKFGAWIRGKFIKLFCTTFRAIIKGAILAIKWLDDTLYKLLHRAIYKTPAPPRH